MVTIFYLSVSTGTGSELYKQHILCPAKVIALMMEAARTSETSVDNYFTWQYIPEDKSELKVRLFSLSQHAD
jgi:hypothetical protein